MTETQNGTYIRKVTLEEARQHIHAQARAGARLPREYNPSTQKFNDELSFDEQENSNISNQSPKSQQQNI